MAWEILKRPLVCRTCGREGEFVYEQATGAYANGPMTFKSLSPGFNFRDTGLASTSVITCSKCNEVVFGPERGLSPSTDKKAS
jgi:hypothetical protein